MHKLRLRAKSISGKDKDKEKESIRSRIQHVTADASRQGTSSTPAPPPPRLAEGLLPAEDNFRTSLILPSLTRRFTLLRAKDGSLVSLDEMRQKLRSQRENGRLTEAEEETLLKQYEIQSSKEAANLSGHAGNHAVTSPDRSRADRNYRVDPAHPARRAPGPPPLPAWSEDRESVASASSLKASGRTSSEGRSLGSSPAMRKSSSGGSSSGHSLQQSRSNSVVRRGAPPMSPYAARSPSVATDMSASLSSSAHATPLTSPSPTTAPNSALTGPASGASAFYAARDAAMRGNSLFGSGAIERDLAHKMTRSESSLNDAAEGHASSSASSSTTRKRRTRRTTGRTDGDLSESSGNGMSPDPGRSPVDQQGEFSVPPVPTFSNSAFLSAPMTPRREKRESYDPFRPRDSLEAERTDASTSRRPSELDNSADIFNTSERLDIDARLPLQQMPFSQRRLNRISRVLEDIEDQLKQTHPFVNVGRDRQDEPVYSQDEADGQLEHNAERPYRRRYGTDEASENDHSQEYGNYSYGPNYGFHDSHLHSAEHEGNAEGELELDAEEGDRRTFHSSASSRNQRAFVYDDTEIIDPPLLRVPSVQEFRSASRNSNRPESSWDGLSAVQPSQQTSDRSSEGHTSRSSAVATDIYPAHVSTGTLEAPVLSPRPNEWPELGHRSDLQVPLSPNTAASGSPRLAYLASSPSSIREKPGNGDRAEAAADNKHPQPYIAADQSNFYARLAESKPDRIVINQIPTSTSSGSVRLPPPMSAVQTSFGLPRSQSSSSTLTRHANPTLHIVEESAPSQQSGETGTFDARGNQQETGSDKLRSPSPHTSSDSSHASASFSAPGAPHLHQASYSQFSSFDSVTSTTPSSLFRPAAPTQKAAVKDLDFSGYAFPSPVPEADDEVFSPRMSKASSQNHASPRNTIVLDQQEAGQAERHASQQTPPRTKISGNSSTRPESTASTGSSWKGHLMSPTSGDFDLGAILESGGDRASDVFGHLSPGRRPIIEAGARESLVEDVDSSEAVELVRKASGMRFDELIQMQDRLTNHALASSNAAAASTSAEHRNASESAPSSGGISSRPTNQLGSPFVPQVEDLPAQTSGGSLAAEEAHEASVAWGVATNETPRPAQADTLSIQATQGGPPPPDASLSRRPDPVTSPVASRRGSEQRLQYNIPRKAPEIPSDSLESALSDAPTSPANPSALPPATMLRVGKMRASNSTPSMLMRSVQQQAEEATQALKRGPPAPQSPVSRTGLRSKRSIKNMKISGPSLVSSSARVDYMPTISLAAAAAAQKSPSHPTRPTTGRSDSDTRTVSPVNRTRPPLHSHHRSDSAGSGGVRQQHSAVDDKHSSGDSSAHGSIRGLMSRFKRRNNSTTIEKHSLPSLPSPGLNSASASSSPIAAQQSPHSISTDEFAPQERPADSVRSVSGSRTPISYNINSLRRRAQGSISSTSTSLVDVAPLQFTPRAPAAPSEPDNTTPQSRSEQMVCNQAVASDHPYAGYGASTPTPDVEHRSAAIFNGQDDMRKLLEAASALGLDSQKVNELIGAAGYARPAEAFNAYASPSRLPASDSSRTIKQMTTAPLTPPQSDDFSSSRVARMDFDQDSSHVDPLEPRHNAHQLAFSRPDPARLEARDPISPLDQKDRDTKPPTPPANRVHRRKPSNVDLLANPLPVPAASADAARAGATTQTQGRPSIDGQVAGGRKSSESHRKAGHSEARKASKSRMSTTSMGSYDAKSIYGLYGTDEESAGEQPPTPKLPDMDVLLASGLIPAADSGEKRASIILASGVDTRRLSMASQDSRVEVTEHSNGDIAFDIVQSLRAGISAGDRSSFYPEAMHRRQISDISIEEEQSPRDNTFQPVNGSLSRVVRPPPFGNRSQTPESMPTYATVDGDALRLLVRRHQKKKKDEVAALKMMQDPPVHHLRPDRNAMGRPNNDPAHRSVLEIIETDEDQVSALIEELTRELDEGQFDLSKGPVEGSTTFHAFKNTTRSAAHP